MAHGSPAPIGELLTPGGCPMSRMSVAVVITRLQAGAGGVALRGAQALDPERYEVTIIAGDCGAGADSDGSGDSMLARAAAAALNVVSVPQLVSPISPADDRRCPAPAHRAPGRGGLRRSPHAQREGRRARPAGRGTRRDAAGRAHVPRLSLPRVPVQGPACGLRRHRALPGPAYRRLPGRGRRGRGRGRPPWHRGARAGPGHQSGHRAGLRARPAGGPRRGTPQARGAGRVQGRRDRRPGRLPEGPRELRRRYRRAGPRRRVRGLDRRRADARENGGTRRPPRAAGPFPVRWAS